MKVKYETTSAEHPVFVGFAPLPILCGIGFITVVVLFTGHQKADV